MPGGRGGVRMPCAMVSEEHTAAELRASAVALAEAGARAARGLFGRVSVSRKADNTPVTEADHVAQAEILSALSRRYPHHGVLTEEELARPDRHAALAGARYCWVIDPIDGTRNFGRGAGLWATSVGVLDRGRPVAGAIYDATTGRVYSAALGVGAFCGAERMVLDDRAIDADTTVAIGSFRRRRVSQAVRGWADRYVTRSLGSLCLHQVWVAVGLADGMYARESKLWDVAAGTLLIEEAGGVATDPAGGEIWPADVAGYRGEDVPIVAGTRVMHGLLLADLRGESGEG